MVTEQPLTPYFRCPGVVIFQGDALDVLRTCPPGKVHCCVTSPPYWGLRDYETATWEGGDPTCDHVEYAKMGVRTGLAAASNHCDGGHRRQEDRKDEQLSLQFRSVCGKCGARRIDRQIGLEETPQAYVERLVAVFREVRRVLRDDGTLWVNLGDSYAADTKWGGRSTGKNGYKQGWNNLTANRCRHSSGLKHKDLVGIPWTVALALRASGWYLRQDIIWHKSNPMPESVRDRCTKSHEYIFLLTKSPRYYFNQQAIKEPATYAGKGRGGSTRRYEQNRFGGDNRQYATRNKRDVWTVNPRPYKGAHFATYPPELIDPCVKAGCPIGGTVLDPFHGSGTTGAVARANGCNYFGIELNPEYIELSKKRFTQPLLL